MFSADSPDSAYSADSAYPRHETTNKPVLLTIRNIQQTTNQRIKKKKKKKKGKRIEFEIN